MRITANQTTVLEAQTAMTILSQANRNIMQKMIANFILLFVVSPVLVLTFAGIDSRIDAE